MKISKNILEIPDEQIARIEQSKDENWKHKVQFVFKLSRLSLVLLVSIGFPEFLVSIIGMILLVLSFLRVDLVLSSVAGIIPYKVANTYYSLKNCRLKLCEVT